MSVSWVSESSRRRAVLAVTAALLLGGFAALAEARTVARAVVQDDSGRVVSRVRVSDRGIEVTRANGDSVDVTLDVDSHDSHVVVDTEGAGLVRLFSDAHVGEDERIDGDVVAVFGSATVEGEVTGNVVAVFGSVRLGPRATVAGDAVAVVGGLDAADGSRVTGDSVSVGFLPLTLGLPALPVVLATILLGWLVSLFFGWMFGVLFPERLQRVSEMASRRTAASLALGIASGPLFVVLMVLLAITIIGVVLAVLLPFVSVVLVYAGQLAATFLLGCRLTRRRPGDGSPLPAMVAGHTLVASLFAIGAVLWTLPGAARTVALFFHLVGLLLMCGLACIGTGAFLLSRFGSAPRQPAPAPAPAAVAPAPPAPAV